MKSKKTKVLHEVCGVPMISYVIENAKSVTSHVVVVLGTNRQQVEPLISNDVSIVQQEKPLGTGHAVLSARDAVGESDSLIILTGDSPLLTEETLGKLAGTHKRSGSGATVLTARYRNPFGYGRIIRRDGELKKIIEEVDASDEEKRINEVNTGTYVFTASELFSVLKDVGNRNMKREYYLTDCIELLLDKGVKVTTEMCDDPEETLGINSREHLAQAEEVLRKRIRQHWMGEGVTMIDPTTVYIDKKVLISNDVTIHPSTYIGGNSSIGEDSVVGPFTSIMDSRIGKGSTVTFSVLREVEIADGVNVGPFSLLRPGAVLEDNSKAGAFVEIKKSIIGKGSKVPHLSYMGDATVGEAVNVGAGSITCNYDGKGKYETEIDDGAFIGSDTMFIAPVKIGKDSITGAGSVISEDVPNGALGIARARQKNIEGYAERHKRKK